jgi:predicted porin
MKKHLIAAAVAAAIAAPAMAQNVTVKGVIDTGVGQLDSGSAEQTTTKSNVIGTTSYSFTGTEDLGGGLKATFNITQEFSMDNGSHTDSSAPTAADYSVPYTGVISTNSFQDASLTLAGNFGSVKLGHLTFQSRDASGVGRFGGNFGRLSSAIRSNGDKVDNAVEYTTPTFNGITVAVGTANQGSASAAAATPKDTGVFVKYAAGAVAVALGQTTRDSGAAADNTETVFGAQYDAGIAKFGLVRGQDNGNNASSAAANLSRLTGTTYQVAVPMANGFTVIAGGSTYKNTAGTADAKGFSLMARKDLSKRTAVYAYTDSMKNKGTVAISASAAGGAAGKTASATGVGILHTF